MSGEPLRYALSDLKAFCRDVLLHEGMGAADAALCADVLADTDAFGIHSHGLNNLPDYVRKFRAGGMDIRAVPEVVNEGVSFAVMDARDALGVVAGAAGMELACRKAAETGVGFVTVRNSSHPGAVGWYSNMAAARGMFGLALTNTNANMAAPGARGKVLGNNPIAFSTPSGADPTMFLDISTSNVAALKVVQAREAGKSVPDSWIVDGEGRPTTDPSRFPWEGALQPAAAHRGYGLALLVDVLCGVLSGGGISAMEEPVSWVRFPEQRANMAHAFLAIDGRQLVGDGFGSRLRDMEAYLRAREPAEGTEAVLTPGEIEWKKYREAEEHGVPLPEPTVRKLAELALSAGVSLPEPTDRQDPKTI